MLLLADSRDGLLDQLIAVYATGNHGVVVAAPGLRAALSNLPTALAARLEWVDDWRARGPFAAALVEAAGERTIEAQQAIAALPGPIPLTQCAVAGRYRLDWLVEEVSTSINTTAAGGNASLMALV